MKRNLVAMSAAMVLVIAACSGGSGDAGDTELPAPETTVATASSPDTTAPSTTAATEETSSGDRSAAKDAAFRLAFPIGSYIGGKVLDTAEEGSKKVLDIFYPDTVKDNLIQYYTIWNKGVDSPETVEGPPVYVWKGIGAGGAVATITMSPTTVDGQDGWLINLEWDG